MTQEFRIKIKINALENAKISKVSKSKKLSKTAKKSAAVKWKIKHVCTNTVNDYCVFAIRVQRLSDVTNNILDLIIRILIFCVIICVSLGFIARAFINSYVARCIVVILPEFFPLNIKIIINCYEDTRKSDIVVLLSSEKSLT